MKIAPQSGADIGNPHSDAPQNKPYRPDRPNGSPGVAEILAGGQKQKTLFRIGELARTD